MIVDDDPRFRALARALLETRGYMVAAEAADGTEAIAATKRFALDAALVDVQLPDIDGLALADMLVETGNGLRIILTSTDPGLVPASALADNPAIAFVPKDKLAATDLAPWLQR
jgi:CheY-like chemotaxis protein